MQFYLQRISRFNSAVQSPVLDGIYGNDTQRAVISFQNAYGLEPTGIVDERTWADIVAIYNGTLDNVQEPEPPLNTVPYPDYVVSVGARGEYVKYIQEALNVINNVFLTIPELVACGLDGLEVWHNGMVSYFEVSKYDLWICAGITLVFAIASFGVAYFTFSKDRFTEKRKGHFKGQKSKVTEE